MASSVQMEAAMSDWSANFNYSPCLHRHVIIETTGGMHFSAGEVTDNIQESLLCLDCLEYLDEEEIRTAWHGEAHFIEIPKMERSHGDD
jgi:hypothetical protein